MQDIDESPWDDSPSGGVAHVAEAEWTRLSSGFQNAGYREGITAGKDGALQEGFDTGFAQTGGPLGRELGLLRGAASALLLHLSRNQTRNQTRIRTRTQNQHEEPHAELESESGSESVASANVRVREIVDSLAAVRFADIAPPPPSSSSSSSSLHEEEAAEGQGQGQGHTAHCVEDLKRSDGLGSVVTTIEDVRALRVKLETLLCESGLKIDLNLEIF